MSLRSARPLLLLLAFALAVAAGGVLSSPRQARPQASPPTPDVSGDVIASGAKKVTIAIPDFTLAGGSDPHALVKRVPEVLGNDLNFSAVFNVLAHCDYPRRYWPTRRTGAYREADFEEHYRTVFRALAASDRALEINTRSPLASVELVRWWWQENGTAVSFGSDAHQPHRVGDRFELAVDIVEAAGFRPGRDRFDFWRR